MKISVVIPAYNEEKYLPKTLESLESLEREPDEVVVVDGGSTDKTVEIARSYGAKVVTVEHRGIGYARQNGLEAAGGEVVAFTDADTAVPHDWLSKIEETLSQEGVSAVYGGFWVADGWWVYRWYINVLQPSIISVFHAFGLPLAPGQNTAFWRKKALAVGGYPLDFKIAEDLEIARRLQRVGRVVYRRDNTVTSSGRRGEEGPSLLWRTFRAFLYYFVTRRADKIGFPDIR